MESGTHTSRSWVTRTRTVAALSLVAVGALGLGVTDRSSGGLALGAVADGTALAASGTPPGFPLTGLHPAADAPLPAKAVTKAEARPAAKPVRASRAERPEADVPPPWIAPVIDSTGIPVTVLKAYRHARKVIRGYNANCHITVALLAAIGRVESDHALGGYVDKTGKTLVPILGPRLDGHPGVKEISDSDGGLYDGDKEFDRAVGPMQFIPTTWTMWASDGNGDKIGDPGNVYDASLAAGWYLCAGSTDLRDPKAFKAAVLRYNHSENYYKTVKVWTEAYKVALAPVPDTKDAAEAMARAEKKAAADRAAAAAAAKAAADAAAKAEAEKKASAAPAGGAEDLAPAVLEPMSDGGRPAENPASRTGPTAPVVPRTPARPAPAAPAEPAAGEAQPSADERRSQKPAASGTEAVGNALSGLSRPKSPAPKDATPKDTAPPTTQTRPTGTQPTATGTPPQDGGGTPRAAPGVGVPVTPVWAGRGGELPPG
jgi:membrane-bound lytic murein transglycosylase B